MSLFISKAIAQAGARDVHRGSSIQEAKTAAAAAVSGVPQVIKKLSANSGFGNSRGTETGWRELELQGESSGAAHGRCKPSNFVSRSVAGRPAFHSRQALSRRGVRSLNIWLSSINLSYTIYCSLLWDLIGFITG